MTFRFHRLRFTCVSVGRDSVYFPPGKAANVIRGALGSTLRDLSCDLTKCTSARTCERRLECGYARIFEPVLDEGPSGMHDPPRPFVLRASQLDGKTFPSGQPFHFEMNLFIVEQPPIAQLTQALSRLADSGLGPSRGRVRISAVDVQEAAIDLAGSSSCDGGALSIDFLTPTELKHGGRIVDKPEFHVLIARIRDRVGSLVALYGGKPLDLDWKGLGERAQAVVLTKWDQRAEIQADRYSTKTRQTHSIGGMTGRAIYKGDFAEFLPLLHAAEVTGVGRQTVWGKGWIRVVALPL